MIVNYKLQTFSQGTLVPVMIIKSFEKFPGAYSFRETPVPISNTEVKSKTLMILGWQRPGKVGSARIKII